MFQIIKNIIFFLQGEITGNREKVNTKGYLSKKGMLQLLQVKIPPVLEKKMSQYSNYRKFYDLYIYIILYDILVESLLQEIGKDKDNYFFVRNTKKKNLIIIVYID